MQIVTEAALARKGQQADPAHRNEGRARHAVRGGAYVNTWIPGQARDAGHVAAGGRLTHPDAGHHVTGDRRGQEFAPQFVAAVARQGRRGHVGLHPDGHRHAAAVDVAQGLGHGQQQFQEERLWAAASAIQALSNCIAWTVEWALERKLFGAALADQQWVQFKLAECKTEVEALRALTYRACELYVQGQDVLELASMAKLKAGRLNRIVPDTCLQFWGGMGYTWENKVSRMYRDGRLASISGGADEVMLGILARIMGMAKRESTPSSSGTGQG